MTVQAAQTQYRQEYIAAFEEGQSHLRSCCVTEAVVKGNTATFLVSGTNGAAAVTRGQNGLIPARQPTNSQLSATLAEWHDLQQLTGFDIFASQGNQRKVMQDGSVKVLNRKIDADIIAQLDTATIDTGASTTASVAMVMKSLAALGNDEVPVQEEDKMFGVISNGFWAYMMQTPEFTKGSYVDVKPFAGPIRSMWRWAGVNWIRHPNLSGNATSTEKCYLFHRDSIGHAMDTEGLKSPIGYDSEQDYSWARATAFIGSKLLQNSGVVQMKHDGSAFALS
ncbi:MAG: hypothetical protein H0U59_08480 [Gemmatimonadaceae bacterium]|nr:hypothetical protein [Gemmatimonadaceae bacterium]